jgi:putative transposase
MAKPVLIRPGMKLNWDGVSYIVHTADSEIFTLKTEKNEYQAIKPSVIFEAYYTNKLKIVTEQQNAVLLQPIQDPEKIAELDRLNKCFHFLENHQFPFSLAARTKAIEIVYNDCVKISESKLYRDYKKWKVSGGSLIALVSRKVTGRASKFSSRMLDLIDDVIDEHYLTKQRKSVSQCYEALKNIYAKIGIDEKLISRSQFYEICNDIDQYEYVLARHGREQARKMYHHAQEIIWADYPLQYVEVDAVHLNLGILSEAGEFLGTIIVYVCIDRYTRAVLGFSTSIKSNKRGEQSESVIECIKHSVFPKPDVNYCNNQWFSFGVPFYFIFDAGSAFNNISVASYILNIESSRVITQTKQPKRKPFIERFFRTLREQLAMKIPGYVGKRSEGIEMDETIQEMATITQAEFERLLRIYICDYYHQSTHKGLDNFTPQQVWNQYYSQSHTSPRLPGNPEAVSAFSGTTRSSNLCPKNGIAYKKLRYNNSELRDLYYSVVGNKTKKFEATYIFNKNDISKIYVVDPRTGELLFVACTDKRILAGTSLSEYESRLSGRAQNKAYFSSDNAAVSEILKKANARKSQKPKKPKAATPLAEQTEPFTDEEIAAMFAYGNGRTVQKVEFDPAGELDESAFFDSGELDEWELEGKL